jgi:hypothetical protein
MDKFEQHIKKMKGLRDVYEVGTGQHNILSILIKDCEEALRQPLVMRSVCCGEELVRFKTYGYDECCGCGKMYRHTDV